MAGWASHPLENAAFPRRTPKADMRCGSEDWPLSSLFDFLTFALLVGAFGASEVLFHTGWFVESLMTQVLVIFVIRTRGNPFKSRPHPLLSAISLSVVAVAILLPFTPIGVWFGLVPLPFALLIALAAMTAVDLLAAARAKHWFYAHFATY
jgi:Mg2+-importing ATPase